MHCAVGSQPHRQVVQIIVKLSDEIRRRYLTAHARGSMWCKICGISNLADAKDAADAGVDAIGLNFYSESPRCVATATAKALSSAINEYAPNVVRVGLFVNHSESEVRAVLAEVPLDMLQFHGTEPAEFCALFDMPFIKVLSMRPDIDFLTLEKQYASAWGLLLDTYHPTQAGGTGETFDWHLWPHGSATKLILAGGLTPDNVAGAISHTQPYGVDVSGGVEGGVKGKKQQQLVRRFIEEAKNV